MTTPTSQALPASLFLAARPAGGAIRLAGHRPGRRGGPDRAGHAHRIPAQTCYEGSAKRPDGTLAFDPRACYPDAAPGAASVAPSVAPSHPECSDRPAGAITGFPRRAARSTRESPRVEKQTMNQLQRELLWSSVAL